MPKWECPPEILQSLLDDVKNMPPDQVQRMLKSDWSPKPTPDLNKKIFWGAFFAYDLADSIANRKKPLTLSMLEGLFYLGIAVGFIYFSCKSIIWIPVTMARGAKALCGK
jgi:hypothetical protein